MAKTISLSHKSKLDSDQTRAALQTVFLSIKDRYSIDGYWKSKKLFVLTGDNLEGSVSLLDNGVVMISLSLGAALMVFSSIIENEIKNQLQKKLG